MDRAQAVDAGRRPAHRHHAEARVPRVSSRTGTTLRHAHRRTVNRVNTPELEGTLPEYPEKSTARPVTVLPVIPSRGVPNLNNRVRLLYRASRQSASHLLRDSISHAASSMTNATATMAGVIAGRIQMLPGQNMISCAIRIASGDIGSA